MWWLLGLLALAHYSNKEKEAVKPPVDLKPKTELDRWLAATPPAVQVHQATTIITLTIGRKMKKTPKTNCKTVEGFGPNFTSLI